MSQAHPKQKSSKTEKPSKLQEPNTGNGNLKAILNEIKIENNNPQHQSNQSSSKEKITQPSTNIDENRRAQAQSIIKTHKPKSPSVHFEKNYQEYDVSAVEKQYFTTIIADLESKLAVMVNEHDRLNNLLLQKHDECEVLKHQLDGKKSTDDSKLFHLVSEIEKLSQALEAANKEIISLRERGASPEKLDVKQREINLFNRVNVLINECDKLAGALQSQTQQNEALRQTNFALAHELQELQASSSRFQAVAGKMDALENKCRDLIEENAKLNVKLQEMTNSNHECAIRIQEFERITSSLQTENLQFRGLLSDANAEIQKIRPLIAEKAAIGSQVANLNAEIQANKKALMERQKEIDSLKNLADAATRENEKLKHQLRECEKMAQIKEKEVEGLKAKCSDFEQLKKQDDSLKAEIDRLRKALDVKTREGESVSSKLHELQEKCKQQLHEATVQINSLVIEKEKLHENANLLLKDNNALNILVNQIPRLTEENEKLQRLLEQVHTEKEELHKQSSREIDMLKGQLSSAQKALADKEKGIEFLRNEKSQLDAVLKARESEILALQTKLKEVENLAVMTAEISSTISKLREDNEELNKALESKVTEAGAATKEAIVLKDVIHNLEKTLATQTEQLRKAELTAIQGSNNLLKAQDDVYAMKSEIDRLTRAHADCQTLASGLQAQVVPIQLENQKLTEENLRLKKELDSTSTSIHRLEGVGETIGLLQKEIQRLNDIIEQKNAEHETLKQKQSYLIEQAASNERRNKEAEQISNLLRAKIEENEIQKNRIAELERQVKASGPEDLRRIIVQLEEQNIAMLHDNEHMFQAMQQMKKELAERGKSSFGSIEEIWRKEAELKQKEEHLVMKEKELLQKEAQLSSETARSRDEVSRGQGFHHSNEEYKALVAEIAVIEQKNAILEKTVQELIKEKEAIVVARDKALSDLEELKRSSNGVNRGQQSSDAQRVKALEEDLGQLREQIDATKRMNEELKNQNRTLQNDLLQVKNELQRKSRELDELKSHWEKMQATQETQKLKQLQSYIANLESQLKDLSVENQRLLFSNDERKKQLDEIACKFHEVEERHNIEAGELKAQIEHYKANHYDAKQIAIRFSAEKASDQNQINQLKQMNNNYREELEKVYELVNERKLEYNKLANDYENLLKAYQKNREELAQVEKTQK